MNLLRVKLDLDVGKNKRHAGRYHQQENFWNKYIPVASLVKAITPARQDPSQKQQDQNISPGSGEVERINPDKLTPRKKPLNRSDLDLTYRVETKSEPNPNRTTPNTKEPVKDRNRSETKITSREEENIRMESTKPQKTKFKRNLCKRKQLHPAIETTTNTNRYNARGKKIGSAE
ncbi:predicted protein [Arabidopsis lyrata subsp. lyrata]|uniref:Predicted protein n=1 Tax=Arabidopsis lyrata subsp. lyrata TaxID=81972 RepID=D7MQ29_ARALL|nr:predicted protein [Arabidopsis lyrata subsp. lyrata]